MSKPTFSDRCSVLRQQALEYITSILQKRGTGYQLCDPDLYEGDVLEEQVTEEIPRGWHTDRHGFYNETPIVVIDIDADGTLSFDGCAGLAEAEDYTYTSNQLTTDIICSIADLIKNLENE